MGEGSGKEGDPWEAVLPLKYPVFPEVRVSAAAPLWQAGGPRCSSLSFLTPGVVDSGYSRVHVRTVWDRQGR